MAARHRQGRRPEGHRLRRQGWLAPLATVVAAAIAVALTGSTAAQAVTGNGSTAVAPVAAALDLNNPVANVNDPAAALAPVDTTCTGSRVDLNKASAATLSTALGVPSDPTIIRLIALRPWLKGADLSSVPGIGPSRAAQLAPQTCASQPPASAVPPRACTSPDQVDLNTASASTISTKLGLEATAVNSLIAARPLPQNLSQVIAPRVPGLPQPKVDRWTQQGLICVTPAPYSSADTTYRWATPTFGTVAQSGAYALIVPAGRTTGLGAYAAVIPEPAEDGVLPRGGFHIYGDWNGEVGVQLPNAEGHSAADEAVIHDAADGPRVSNGNAAVTGTSPGSVLVAATSLSDFITTLMTSNCLAAQPGYLAPSSQVWCVSNLRDTPLATAFTNTLAYQAHFAGRLSGPCPAAANPLLTVHGTMWDMTCTGVAVDGSTGSVSWRNDSGSALYFGNVYQYTGLPNRSDVTVTRSLDKGAFTTSIFNRLSLGLDVVAPGDSFRFDVRQDQGTSTTAVRTSPYAASFWTLSQFTSLLDAGLTLGIGEGQLAGCAVSLANQLNLQNFGGCAGTIVANDARTAAKAPGLSKEDRLVLASIAKKAGALGDALTGLDFVLSGVEWGAETAPDTATYEFRSPPPVVQAGGGSGGGSGSLASGSPVKDGRYIARIGTAGYLVTPASGTRPPVALSITSGGDFDCYATGYFVVDHVTTFRDNNEAVRMNLPGLPLVDRATAGAPHCTAMSATWDYTPVASGGNVPNGVILREDAQYVASGQPQKTYLVNAAGRTQSIPDGGTYLCLAARYPIVWNVPIQDLPIPPSTVWTSDPVDAAC